MQHKCNDVNIEPYHAEFLLVYTGNCYHFYISLKTVFAAVEIKNDLTAKIVGDHIQDTKSCAVKD